MEIALFSAKEKGRMKKLSFFHTPFAVLDYSADLPVRVGSFCVFCYDELVLDLLFQLRDV